MSEKENSLVKASEPRLPKFVEDAYQSIENMEKFADMLLKSKLVPNHFYEEGANNKPDFSKGKTASVVAVLIQGYQLQLPPMTALQHVIPVNGLLSIKGDLAKTLIFNSGKLKIGSWREEETGTIEEENFAVKITATRTDNGQTLSRSFSVAQAKRAGLWITESQTKTQDGWRKMASAWWKYPARMINYRALGFLARDLFPDVMNGVYTTEEAMDMPKDTTVIVETESGAHIEIPDKEFSSERSGNLTKRAIDKISGDKFGQVVEPVKPSQPGGTESPFKSEKGSAEYFMGALVASRNEDGEPLDEADNVIGKTDIPSNDKGLQAFTLKILEEMKTEDLLKLIEKDSSMQEAMNVIPGKNTNKKLREIILAHQDGKLQDHINKLCPPADNTAPGIEIQSDDLASGMKPNTAFDIQAKAAPVKDNLIQAQASELNRYGIDVPGFSKGNEREFSEMKKLFEAMLGVKPRLDNPRYLDLQRQNPDKYGLDKYKTKEEYCKYATIEEVCGLLNENAVSL